ncbi:hypothetical protein HPB50_016153 [Hyalomma asiaticum]|uniref:Uncharacterized protein n=1 Tax=Hyalomma asiaticum TaxID=266040 RepID=A0ACB7TAJ7_HYAAI|nr:hypothetical protein HPB50_016153 [Hyalomma asiaticum]
MVKKACRAQPASELGTSHTMAIGLSNVLIFVLAHPLDSGHMRGRIGRLPFGDQEGVVVYRSAGVLDGPSLVL